MPAHTLCRICETPLPAPFLDLGAMPPANDFLSSEAEFAGEETFPLAVTGCPSCRLVQLTYVVPPERLYRDYPYVSSTSEAVRRYADELAARLTERYRLGPSDLVVELGSNDGLLLAAFQRRGVRVHGVEPAKNLAAMAQAKGVPTLTEFFAPSSAGRVAEEAGKASLLIGRHVFAHLDRLHDFFDGVLGLLAPEGSLLIEVPYLGNLIDELEFDTLYHEHLSYISLEPLLRLCRRHGFFLADVERVWLHGGSVLLTIRRSGNGGSPSPRVEEMLGEELRRRLGRPETLQQFAGRVAVWKQRFEGLIEQLVREGAHLVGYGAAAKANTLLNFCPTAAGALSCILDRSPHKQGLYTPGTHLPVVSPEKWNADGATHMVVLAWNFKEEIMAQMRPFAERGGRFVIPIPEPQIL